MKLCLSDGPAGGLLLPIFRFEDLLVQEKKIINIFHQEEITGVAYYFTRLFNIYSRVSRCRGVVHLGGLVLGCAREVPLRLRLVSLF